jgi:hypothetical protein
MFSCPTWTIQFFGMGFLHISVLVHYFYGLPYYIFERQNRVLHDSRTTEQKEYGEKRREGRRETQRQSVVRLPCLAYVRGAYLMMTSLFRHLQYVPWTSTTSCYCTCSRTEQYKVLYFTCSTCTSSSNHDFLFGVRSSGEEQKETDLSCSLLPMLKFCFLKREENRITLSEQATIGESKSRKTTLHSRGREIPALVTIREPLGSAGQRR